VPPETYGRRLARLRAERGLTLRQLACPGVTAAYISRLEHDDRHASVGTTRKLAEKLGVPWQHLETGEAYAPVVVDGESYDVPAAVAAALNGRRTTMQERTTSGERIVAYRDQAGEWRWRWVAANDSDTLADSGEGYINEADMLRGAAHVRGDRDIPIVDADGNEIEVLEEAPKGE
jgi:transcriptional regulator with XRE-family HTH domain